MKRSILPYLLMTAVVAGCGRSTEGQMVEYLEFYYPTTGGYTYDIVFDWGSYLIVTGPNAEEELHADSEPYRGYITMRPYLNAGATASNLPLYLITPAGEVFTRPESGEIPEIRIREEVTIEKKEYGTSTMTTTIQSPLEPIVDDFVTNREGWKAYGHLEASGTRSRFHPAEP